MRRDLVISSELTNLEKVRVFLEQFFLEASVSPRLFNRVFLGLSEAVNNSIIHGNCFNENKQVFIEVWLIDRILMIEVKDEGCGFLYEEVEDPTSLQNVRKENGRGIFLIKRMADYFEYSDSGRSVKFGYNIG